MCVQKGVICLLAIVLMSVLSHGASIEKSISVSVSTSSSSSSESKSEHESAIEKANPRSLNSAEIREGKVEISAPYARKVINNFSIDDKRRSLKEQSESTTKKEIPITTENPKSEPEITPEITTTELNQQNVISENVFKKIEFDLNSQIKKESSDTTTEKDANTTILSETTSKKEDVITTGKPESEPSSTESSSTEPSSTEPSSTQTSSTEISSTESSSTESSTTGSSSTENISTELNSTETTATELSSTEPETETETVTETTQINLTSDNVDQTGKSLESRSLKQANSTTDNDRIVFIDQTESTMTTQVPKVDLDNRSGTGTEELCDAKVGGECRQVFP